MAIKISAAQRLQATDDAMQMTGSEPKTSPLKSIAKRSLMILLDLYGTGVPESGVTTSLKQNTPDTVSYVVKSPNGASSIYLDVARVQRFCSALKTMAARAKVKIAVEFRAIGTNRIEVIYTHAPEEPVEK